jgi:hypothetical protein
VKSTIPGSPWRYRELSAYFFGADDRARTGDLDLGKVALYQLSYVRVVTQCSRCRGIVQVRDIQYSRV